MRRNRLLLLSLVINLIFFIVGYFVLIQVNVNWLRDWISSYGYFAPVVYVLVYILFFVVPFNPFPKSIITYFSLLSFGPFNALMLTLLADVVSITINYSLFRNFHRLLSDRRKKMISKFSSKNGWKALLVARTFPITNGYSGADFPSYAAGVSKMPYLEFILASMAPWIVLDIVYFYGAETVIHSSMVIPVFTIFVTFSVVYAIYKYRKGVSA
jgi:uncharacterized membrane protein YdjX (TVP38/TMEM64 family)